MILKVRTTWIAILLFVKINYSIAQTSLILYNNSGKLEADSNFILSKPAQKHWSKFGFRIVNTILDSLTFPPVSREAGADYKLILSFVVDETGTFSRLRPEKFFIPACADSTGHFVTITAGIKACSGKHHEEGFRAKPGRTEKYYIPIWLKSNALNAGKFVEDGWIVYRITPPEKMEPIAWPRTEPFVCNGTPEPRPKCQQPKQPKGLYHQISEQYSSRNGKDTLISFLEAQLFTSLNFKRRHKISTQVRKCVSACTPPDIPVLLFEKRGIWEIKKDTVIIIWKYQRHTNKGDQWVRLYHDSLVLKYEAHYQTPYSPYDCRSALTRNGIRPFTGYGRYESTGLGLLYRKARLKLKVLAHISK